jgi:hypothetical protein
VDGARRTGIGYAPVASRRRGGRRAILTRATSHGHTVLGDLLAAPFPRSARGKSGIFLTRYVPHTVGIAWGLMAYHVAVRQETCLSREDHDGLHRATGLRSSAMADIPIHNETDYVLTAAMTQDILRDAQEHFGAAIRTIRVQAGLARHAWNARTQEVRYAFSPQDFGVVSPLPPAPERLRSRRRPSRSDEEPEAEILPASFEDGEGDEEDIESLETSLDSLDEGPEDDEDEDGFRLDAPVEEVDDDEEDALWETEDEEE